METTLIVQMAHHEPSGIYLIMDILSECFKMMSHFETLPPELQTQILEQEFGPEETRKYIRTGRQVSRSFRAATHRAYLNQICVEAPSDKEIKRYFNRNPQIFGFFTPNINASVLPTDLTPVETRYVIFLNVGNNQVKRPPAYEMIGSDVHYFLGSDLTSFHLVYSTYQPFGRNFDRTINVVFDRFWTIKTRLDPVSLFRILSNRLDRLNLDPNFARTFVINQFHSIVKSYHLNNVYELLCLFLYLDGTCRVMNLLTAELEDIFIPIENPPSDIDTTTTNPTLGLVTVNDARVEHDLKAFQSSKLLISPSIQSWIDYIRAYIPRLIDRIERHLNNLII